MFVIVVQAVQGWEAPAVSGTCIVFLAPACSSDDPEVQTNLAPHFKLHELHLGQPKFVIYLVHISFIVRAIS